MKELGTGQEVMKRFCLCRLVWNQTFSVFIITWFETERFRLFDSRLKLDDYEKYVQLGELEPFSFSD